MIRLVHNNRRSENSSFGVRSYRNDTHFPTFRQKIRSCAVLRTEIGVPLARLGILITKPGSGSPNAGSLHRSQNLSLEICERCRLYQQNSPATPKGSAVQSV